MFARETSRVTRVSISLRCLSSAVKKSLFILLHAHIEDEADASAELDGDSVALPLSLSFFLSLSFSDSVACTY